MRGFFGLHTIAFVLMVAVVRKLRPTVFLHECTQNFQFTIFVDLLEDLCLGFLSSAIEKYTYVFFPAADGLKVLDEHVKVFRPWGSCVM